MSTQDETGRQRENPATQPLRRDRRDNRAVPPDAAEATHPGAVRAREEEQYGGIKPGSAFFGWVTATGMTVLLVALLAGVTVRLADGTDVDEVARDTQTLGTVGGIALLVILFVAYYCGGYVAGRMARFDGAKQGLAVWLWAVLVAALVAAGGAVVGGSYDVLAQTNSLPPFREFNEGELTTGGIVAAMAIAVVSLVGAILGGMGGMRFHRKVDRQRS